MGLRQSASTRELVPDEITDFMVCERLSQPDTSEGFILDGYPRTMGQASFERGHGQSAASLLSSGHRVSDGGCKPIVWTSHLPSIPDSVPDSILKPGLCDRCRGPLYQHDDDNPKTVRDSGPSITDRAID